MKPTTVLIAILITGAAAFTFGRALAAPDLKPETRENLNTAMHGEAFAYAKYLLFANQARQDGHPEIADLFEQTAKVERSEHLAEEAELLNLVGDTAANLRDAIAGESYEVDTMYRDFAAKAETAGDSAAAMRFEEIRRDEIAHRDAFKAALDKLQAANPER